MSQESKDAGIIAVLVHRLEKFRLPTVLDLQKKVNNGSQLDEFDIIFLQEVMEDASEGKRMLDRHPEYSDLIIKMISLYHEIVKKALENEEKL